MSLHKDPQERLDQIETALEQPSLDPELRAEIDEKLADVYQEFISLQSDQAFEQHMSRYVTDEYNARQRGERGPLCTCSLPTCPLTNGEIPGKLRYNANTVFKRASGRKRVLEYLHTHPGGEVLHEMLEEWDRRESELHRKIGRIQGELGLEDRRRREVVAGE